MNRTTSADQKRIIGDSSICSDWSQVIDRLFIEAVSNYVAMDGGGNTEHIGLLFG